MDPISDNVEGELSYKHIVVANERQGQMIYAKKIASGENTKPNQRIGYGDIALINLVNCKRINKGDSH